MKILFMANVLPNPNSGAAGTEVQTIKALRELGHTVDEVWENDLSHHISHYNLYYLMELPLAYRSVMKKRFQNGRYDVVHVNQPHGYLAAKALPSIDPRAVFVHRSHGFEPRVRDALSGWKKKFSVDKRPLWRRASSAAMERCLGYNTRQVTRYAHGHIVYATECGDFLNERYGVPRDRIAVVPPAPPASYQEAELLPMTESRIKKLLYVGQYSFFKAPMILARAVELILRALPETTMTWVCDSRHHAEAKALFADDLRGRVSFEDWQGQDGLRDIYDDHGVFLFPSFFEGFGKVFLEAMSRGLVVVAADNGGMKDVIVHGRSGFLVPTGSVEDMAHEAINVIASPPLFRQLSKAARERSLQYSWRRAAEESVRFYQSLVRGP